MDARSALELIEHTGLSLTEACQIALEQRPTLKKVADVPLHKLVSDFMDDARQRGLRGGTLEYYDAHLNAFLNAVPSAKASNFTREKLQAFFKAYPGDGGGAAARFRAVRAMFNWAEKQDPCPIAVNPVKGMTVLSPPKESEIEFFTMEEVIRILANVESPHREALALGFFAGLRPTEICGGFSKPGLTWENINRKEKQIRVPSAVAKGSSRKNNTRIINAVPNTLWAWIKGAPKSGPIYEFSARTLAERARRAGGLENWKYDGVRHTFATYHVAAYRDPGKTSLILGHKGSLTMLRDHYMGLATKAQGTAYFKLRP